ncbi:MAG: hypothetical protein UZ22_OP11002000312 [Microgenomates bacterium OLB23]|nr:MAG: hypothetical protein UZ22_OP11002000312 [Microgenomates bacterium OLB23]
MENGNGYREALERRWYEHHLELNNLIIGCMIGLCVVVLRLTTKADHADHGADPIMDTIYVAVYLTALVAYSRFSFPTLFAGRPRLATMAIVFVAGHVSLLFDSFAVILLLVTLKFKEARVGFSAGGNVRFNSFVVTVAASVCALTVGAGFWLGELWAISHYIKSGFAQVISGFPLLIVLTPFNLLVAGVCAALFPVDVECVAFDRQQLKEGVLFLAFLTLLVVTHDPILCGGLLLTLSFLRTDTKRLMHSTLDELKHGAAPAIGLIVFAWLLKELPFGVATFIEQHATGPWIAVLAMISSPFAGAMIAPSTTPAELYVNLSWMMLGAPMLTASSLVALIVFKERIDWTDIPPWLKAWIGWLPGATKDSHMQEYAAYTLVSVPLIMILGVMLWAANSSGVFAAAYNLLAAAP